MKEFDIKIIRDIISKLDSLSKQIKSLSTLLAKVLKNELRWMPSSYPLLWW